MSNGKKLADKGDTKKRGPARDFAENLVKQMDEEDFLFLLRRYLGAKKQQTDAARPEDIQARFEYYKIEEEGLLTACKDILPHADLLLVTLNGERCVILARISHKQSAPTARCRIAAALDSKNILDILQVCLRVFFFVRLASIRPPTVSQRSL